MNPSLFNPALPSVVLSVQAADPVTEIFVVDSQFQRIAKGVGQLETVVPPGLYKVRFRAGVAQVDHLVEVEGEKAVQVVQKQPMAFETAMPLNLASREPSPYALAAQTRSLRSPITCGQGSGLFLWLRNPQPGGLDVPCSGVSLHTLDGEALGQLARDRQGDNAAEYSSLSLAVAPGVYRLRVEAASGETTAGGWAEEMFVVAIADWQSQIFAQVEAASPWIGPPRISLPTAAMFMAPLGQGFDPASEVARQVELVRQGLMSGRPVITLAEVRSQLAQQRLNPLLGILAAHLLLAQPTADYAGLAEAITQMEYSFGPDFSAHPDVRSLWLQPELGRPLPADPWLTPPMLRRSWHLLVQASRRRPDLVPPGSLCDRIADGLLYSAPWLIHRLPRAAETRATETRTTETDQTDASGTPASLDAALHQAHQQFQHFLSLSPAQRSQLKTVVLHQAQAFTPLEQNLLNATVFRAQLANLAEESQTPQLERDDFLALLHAIDAPSSAIFRAIDSLYHKLTSQTTDYSMS